MIFQLLKPTNIFDSCNVIMTDYEIAIANAFEEQFQNQAQRRMCFFHISSFLKKRASLLNCLANSGLVIVTGSITPNIFNLFVVLVFLNQRLLQIPF